jgi:hypothetical protein
MLFEFDFRLNIGNLNKNYFVMNSKYENLFMAFKKIKIIAYSLKLFLNGHVLN